jgi:peptide/nickel transport system ATP-binding protein
MRQRVVIALATFSQPSVVLADEPTTGLDVVVQRGILTMLAQVRAQTRSSLVLVSHDMGVHFQITDRLAVMYAGRVVEQGPTRSVFSAPRHPYTKALIDSLPRIGDARRREGLAGTPPRPRDKISSCPFADRCPAVMDVCRRVAPPIARVGEAHQVACHLWTTTNEEAA